MAKSKRKRKQKLPVNVDKNPRISKADLVRSADLNRKFKRLGVDRSADYGLTPALGGGRVMSRQNPRGGTERE